jgi:hypothetical protein
MRLIDTRNWLEEGERPTKLYFFELHSGEKGESDNPLCLFDLIWIIAIVTIGQHKSL